MLPNVIQLWFLIWEFRVPMKKLSMYYKNQLTQRTKGHPPEKYPVIFDNLLYSSYMIFHKF